MRTITVNAVQNLTAHLSKYRTQSHKWQLTNLHSLLLPAVHLPWACSTLHCRDKLECHLNCHDTINSDVLHLQDMPATNLVEFLHNHICNVANNVFGQKQPPSAHRHYHKPWFDTECRVEKRHVMTFLKDNPKSEFARTLQRNLKHCSSVRKEVMKSWRGYVCARWPKLTP